MSLNVTGCSVSGVPAHQALRATYIGLDFLLTLLGNILTIIVTRRVEEFSASTKFLITSLALADLGVSFVVGISLVTEIVGRWVFPQWICVASFLCFYTFTAVSVYMIILMTFDRLVAVVRPLRYALILTKRRCVIAVGAVCFVSVSGAIVTTTTNEVKYNECSALCTTTGRSIIQSVVSVVVFYLVPLSLILLMNIKLLSVAHRHAKRSRNHVRAFRSTLALNVPNQPPHIPGIIRGKAVGIITLITCAFILSWSFFYVKLMHTALSDGRDVFPEWMEFTAMWIALTNSWWNVIIYSIMNRSFRGNLTSVLRRPCPWCSSR